ncbi:hypothetical protein CkP1_0045 [Citrobacter phage CkP1]|nr:hypothetical protein CkP1_0045 [Citrobacter phage CkP1]
MNREIKSQIFDTLKKEFGLNADQTIFDLSEQGQIDIQKSFETLINPDTKVFQAFVKINKPDGIVRIERRTIEV